MAARDDQKVFSELLPHLDVGRKLYSSRSTDTEERLHDVFEALCALLPRVETHHSKLSHGAPKFDFVHAGDGPVVEANGYRSLLHILSCCLHQLLSALQAWSRERTGLLYTPGNHLNVLTAYCRALQGLDLMLHYAVMLMEANPTPRLHCDDEMSEGLKRVLFGEYICRDVFYGECLGLQYSPSLRRVLRMIAFSMASYKNFYKEGQEERTWGSLFRGAWRSSKLWQSPSLMGRQLDELTQHSSPYFARAFWSIPEQDSLRFGTLKLMSRSVDISCTLEIPGDSIVTQGSKGEVMLTPPLGPGGVDYKPLKLLLVSNRWRSGQPKPGMFFSRSTPCPLSTGLIVHIHGGGFIAQTPKSHEFYLRTWTIHLKFPIVSIDYSLAPEAPFPTALDEIVFAYSWILKNLKRLGTTGEKIVFIGDSAGGNLVITATMKLKDFGLRLPDRIIPCYPVTLLRTVVSPSRFLTLTDPILPIGIMFACLNAYNGKIPSNDVIEYWKETRRKIMEAKGFCSLDSSGHILGNQPVIFKKMLKPVKPITSTIKQETMHHPTSSPPCLQPLPTIELPSGSEAAAKDPTDTAEPNGDVIPNGTSSDPPPTTTAEVECSPPSEGGETESDSGGAVGGEHQGSSSLSDLTATEECEDTTEEEAPLVTVPSSHRTERLSPAELKAEALLDELLESISQYDLQGPPDPYQSPALAPDELLVGLPPINIIAAAMDPMLDDSIAMARRLVAVGQQVTLNVMQNLPHGFLAIPIANDENVISAHNVCLTYLQMGLGRSPST